MPGCPNGAVPTDLARGTQQVLDKVNLAASVANLIINHNRLAYAAFAASLVNVNDLCASNPDPPEALNVEDFVAAAGYAALPPLAVEQLLTNYIFRWLRYQAFTQFCVCVQAPVDPVHNCIHRTNFTPNAGINAVTDLGQVVIDDVVYNSWPAEPGPSWRILRNAQKTTAGAADTVRTWDVQVQYTSGQWISLDSNLTVTEAVPTDRYETLQGSPGLFPRTVNMRLLSNAGAQKTLSSFDYCFKEIVPSPTPLPPQPDLPTLPTLPAPTCSSEDLCAIVEEIARQLTRVSLEVSDIKAALTTTDQFTEIAQTSITGEGELSLALGTRAVSVELTALSSGAFTSALGRPRGLMRVGSVRWGDGIGYSPRAFIDGDRYDALRPNGALTLSYQLLPPATAIVRMLG